MSKKCIAVHLPIELLEKIDELKTKSGRNQSAIMTDLIEKGLDYSGKEKSSDKEYFFLKVRIDVARMKEFGEKLQNGEIDTSHTIITYCLKEDPEVGLNFWEVDNTEELERVLAQYQAYYKEIIEIVRVVTPMNAMKLIIENTVQFG